MTSKTNQSDGREDNAAQPLGERSGLVNERERGPTLDKSRRAAGPDGPDAGEIGRTFKKKPSKI